MSNSEGQQNISFPRLQMCRNAQGSSF